LNNETRSTNPYAPPTASVGDVQVEGEAEPAGRGVRFGAYLLDALIAAVFTYVPFFALGGASLFSQAMQAQQADPTDPTAAFAIYSGLPGLGLFIGFIAWIAVTLKFVLANRQTIAKKLLGIKVTRSDGSQIGIGRLFWLRNFVPGIIAVVPFVGILFVLVDALMIFGATRQCLHDRIADSIVVRA
jgi:uncharacterized RDD family membrane protein YckC